MNKPQTITKVTPVELIMVEYIDGNYKTEKALVVVEAGFDISKGTDLDKDSVKVLDVFRSPPGQWKLLSYTSRWFIQALHKLLNKSTEIETPNDTSK